MHNYHKEKKIKEEFKEFYKNFEFITDSKEATVQNKSKLLLELQNVSKSCMKRVMQIDGS